MLQFSNKQHEAVRNSKGRIAFITRRQTRFPFGDAIDAQDGERARLIHEQHAVERELHFEHGALHPHQGDLQEAIPAQPDHPAGAGLAGAPTYRRPQLAGKHLHRRGALPLTSCVLWFVHYSILHVAVVC